MDAEDSADAALARVAGNWSDDGWEVVLAPAADSLPEPLRAFGLDLVARREGRSCAVAVLIRGRARGTQDGDLSRLAAAVPTVPGWTLVVEWVGDVPDAAAAAVLRRRRRRVDDLLAHDPEAALLMAWSSAEGAMVALAPPGPGDKARKGLALANYLHDRGVLDEDTLAVLRRAQRYRGQVAHGRSAAPVPAALVGELAAVADRLLREIRPADRRA